MAVVRIEHADADADRRRRRRAGGGRRQRAAAERVLGKPYGVITVRLGDFGEGDAVARVGGTGQTHAQFGQLGHA